MNEETEVILNIEENGFVVRYPDGLYKWNDSYDGYVVTTNKRQIKVGVQSGQCCCENYGYVCSEDDYKQFLNSTLLAVNVVDQAMNKKTDIDYYCGGIVFVDFETTNGLFQLAVYNSHNGYYGHTGLVLSDDVELYRECL